MYRSHNCGELRMDHVGQTAVLSGWVQSNRDFGGLTFIDLRDRYGITQVVFNMDDDVALCEEARKIGREFVVKIEGLVRERSNKNPNRATGDIEFNESNSFSPSKKESFNTVSINFGGKFCDIN